MSVSLTRGLGAVSALALCTSPGWADVTAQDVWSEWKDYMSGVGYDVSAQESASGGEIVITDLVVSMPIPEGEGSGAVEIGEMTLIENGDGTVSISLPDSFPVVVKVSEGGEDVEITLDVAQANSAMIVSGEPGDITSNYNADLVTMALGSIKADGFTLPPEVANLSFSMSNIASETRQIKGEARRYSQTASADAFTITGAFDDPESDDQGTLNATMNSVLFEGAADIPENMDLEDMRANLDAGFGFEGGFSYASATAEASGVGDGETFAFQSSVQGGSAVMAMNAAELVYELLYEDMDVTVQGGGIPFPLNITLSELGMNLGMPLAVSDEIQDFAMGVSLRDLAVPDFLWGLVDPAGALPHDPATLVLDLTGKTKLLFDLMDPASILAMGDQPPGELHALSINELLVSAVGARVTGGGAFTFDNTDLASFDGMPAPTGKASVEVVGANQLIDTLIEMGLVAEGDAMGARLMMGMLGVPGEGEDTLVSEIEFGEDGSISANGQRLK